MRTKTKTKTNQVNARNNSEMVVAVFAVDEGDIRRIDSILPQDAVFRLGETICPCCLGHFIIEHNAKVAYISKNVEHDLVVADDMFNEMAKQGAVIYF